MTHSDLKACPNRHGKHSYNSALHFTETMETSIVINLAQYNQTVKTFMDNHVAMTATSVVDGLTGLGRSWKQINVDAKKQNILQLV